MEYAYLLADSDLDRMFGFKLVQAQVLIPRGISQQEFHITNAIQRNYKYKPVVRDVFVVWNNDNNERDLIGKINVHSKKQFDVSKVSLRMNPDIRLNGSYLDELKKYLIENSKYDKVVIARSRISPSVKADMERLVGELHLRAEIFPDMTQPL
jgi:hypothetical protein